MACARSIISSTSFSLACARCRSEPDHGRPLANRRLASLLLSAGAAHAGEHFACNLKALSAPERARHAELGRALFAAVAEKRELQK
jgi:hypothetical protein